LKIKTKNSPNNSANFAVQSFQLVAGNI